jgi:hypothetical protein
MLTAVLFALATLCAAIAALIGFDWGISGDHPLGWLSLACTFAFGAFLVGAVAPLRGSA